MSLQKGQGKEVPRAAELVPGSFVPFVCCSWVRSLPLPLPLCFCGEATSVAPNWTRAEQTVIISFPGQGRSPSLSARPWLFSEFSRPPTQR